jgi:cation diffusion facilitator CzcD-associated flavoprotein CzcO
LSAATLPAFPGAEDFAGPIYHTGQWPQGGVDFAGLRVGVIGTGSSGVQAIPMIAQQAAHLTVFQRTAHYSVPARNRPLTDVERHATKREYDLLRSIARSSSKTGLPSENQPLGPAAVVDDTLLHAELERRWWLGISLTNTLADSFISLEANERIAQWVRAKIRQIVDDPTTADLLASSNYPIGTKRIIYGTDFFETFNRPNVDLVSVVATPIEQFTTNGIVVDGREHEFDAIVCATGYDAITGALERIELRGRDGRLLSDVWAEGPKTYLGLAVHGFPNLFTVTGPGSPSVLSNMVVSIEQHVEWIVDYIERLRIDGIAWTEPEVDAQEAWVSHVNELANATLFPTAASWYMGANVPGKPRVFLPYLGGISAYRQKCDDVRADSYRGFAHGSGKEGQRSLQGTTA